MYEVLWLQSAVDDLYELNGAHNREIRRILTTVRSFGRDGRGDRKKLRGRADWRLRAGDWRVFYTLDGARCYVTRVDNRRDAYEG